MSGDVTAVYILKSLSTSRNHQSLVIQKSVKEKEPKPRPNERIEQRLQHIRDFDSGAIDADAFEDADELTARDGIDENNDENRDGSHGQAYGAQGVAEHNEGIDHILEKFRLSVGESLNLGNIAYSA